VLYCTALLREAFEESMLSDRWHREHRMHEGRLLWKMDEEDEAEDGVFLPLLEASLLVRVDTGSCLG